ncbi:putative transposase [Nitrosospira sp. Nsp18]|uniref:transposase n=1 Tax=Nitrosospira sp. Nsp18 TaxID=1855334 RepID=UPI000887A3F4|nr:putative transposase [Nitrosospira sp. Nsp18]
MKRSRFTEMQIAYALRQAEAGMPVRDVCSSPSTSKARFYKLEEEIWRRACGRGPASELST